VLGQIRDAHAAALAAGQWPHALLLAQNLGADVYRDTGAHAVLYRAPACDCKMRVCAQWPSLPTLVCLLAALCALSTVRWAVRCDGSECVRASRQRVCTRRPVRYFVPTCAIRCWRAGARIWRP
jgi:hypothetical protein